MIFNAIKQQQHLERPHIPKTVTR